MSSPELSAAAGDADVDALPSAVVPLPAMVNV